MEERPETLPVVRLSPAGQTYVALVGLLAWLSTTTHGWGWYVALLLAAMPLSPLGLWVGFYASVSVGWLLTPGESSWPVTLAWMTVWVLTAWLNARLLEKWLHRGWTGRWVSGDESA